MKHHVLEDCDEFDENDWAPPTVEMRFISSKAI
jgi:hypothetical protein